MFGILNAHQAFYTFGGCGSFPSPLHSTFLLLSSQPLQTLFLDPFKFHLLLQILLLFLRDLQFPILHMLPSHHQLMLKIRKLRTHNLLQLLNFANIDIKLNILMPLEAHEPKKAYLLRLILEPKSAQFLNSNIPD